LSYTKPKRRRRREMMMWNGMVSGLMIILEKIEIKGGGGNRARRCPL